MRNALTMVVVVFASLIARGADIAFPADAKVRNIGANIVFPADAKVRNIKSEFGAKGDGTTDDTAAIQKAFETCQQKHMEVVYFPNGTYLVSKPIHFRGWMFVQGESREKTVLLSLIHI